MRSQLIYMTFKSNNLGRSGEAFAENFLNSLGYKIMERNFRNYFGEVDIIAKHKGVICFVEVKTRRTDAQGSPFEAVTSAKQKKLIQVAQSYLQDKGWEEKAARFDVVAVFTADDGALQADIVEDAFGIN